MELIDFLRARLADDERLARECIAEVGPERAGERFTDDSGDATRDSFPSYPWGSQDDELAYMAGPGHPARVLAEVEAKRRVLELHKSREDWTIGPDDREYQTGHACVVDDDPYPCQTLELLAAAYAQHEDYDAARWTP